MWAVLCKEASAVKLTKMFLEECGLFDAFYRIHHVPAVGFLLPLKTQPSAEIAWNENQTLLSPQDLSRLNISSFPRSKVSRAVETPRDQLLQLLKSRYPQISAEEMDRIQKWIPLKWERYDDFLLWPQSENSSNQSEEEWLKHGPWSFTFDEFFKLMSTAFGVKQIAQKSRINAKDPVRQPHIRWLYPRDRGHGTEPFWTRTLQNGIYYHWAPEYTMFCTGNITEKQRVASFQCQDEIILDMYAGIGYFTLPYLLHAQALQVIACEWNSYSVQGLIQSLTRHKLTFSRDSKDIENSSFKAVILEGDNQLFHELLRNRVDRVNMGLLPDCRRGLPMAVAALRQDRGGRLHVHENVMLNHEEEWLSDLLKLIQKELNSLKRTHWTISVEHLEVVKPFAPRVNHLVADLHVRPSSSRLTTYS